ncbi:MAG: hypothetical protein ACRCTI_03430 [Beijerinckiaceae bacterium]
MDNVLPFPRAGRRGGGIGAETIPQSAVTADILLFTGVRYERHAIEPQNAAGASLGRDDNPTPPRRKTRRRA